MAKDKYPNLPDAVTKPQIASDKKAAKEETESRKADAKKRISPSDKVGPKMDRGTTKKVTAKPSASKKTPPKATSAFGKAFAENRKSGAKEFTFGGKKYNTKIKGEK